MFYTAIIKEYKKMVENLTLLLLKKESEMGVIKFLRF